MAWSTQELARLAGTTVNTIRHYHRLGLLSEPQRRYNGYKEYGVLHLVRLLRIRRLADLGVPLSQVDQVSAGGDSTEAALREVDADLATSIERLQKARDDIAVILRDGAPADAPSGFTSVASRLSYADSSMIHLYSRLYDEDALVDLKKMVEGESASLNEEIDALPADADEATKQRLIEQLAPTLMQNMIDYPWLNEPAARLSKNARAAQQTFVDAVVELYNSAQLDVFGRASILANEQLRAARPTSDDSA